MAFQGLSSLPDDPLASLPNDPAASAPRVKTRGLESLPDDPLGHLPDDPGAVKAPAVAPAAKEAPAVDWNNIEGNVTTETPGAWQAPTPAEAARVVGGILPKAGQGIVNAVRGGVGLAGQALEGMTSESGPNAEGNPLSRYGRSLREEAATGTVAQLMNDKATSELITPKTALGRIIQTIPAAAIEFAPGTATGMSGTAAMGLVSGLHSANTANEDLAPDDPNRLLKMGAATTVGAASGAIAGKMVPDTMPLSRAFKGAPWQNGSTSEVRTQLGNWLWEAYAKTVTGASALTGGQAAEKAITGGKPIDLGDSFLQNLATIAGFTIAHGAAQARAGSKSFQTNDDGTFSFKAEAKDPESGDPVHTWVTAKIDPDGIVKVQVPLGDGTAVWVKTANLAPKGEGKAPEPAAAGELPESGKTPEPSPIAPPVAPQAPPATRQSSPEVEAMAQQVQDLQKVADQTAAVAQQHPHVEEAQGNAEEAADLLQAAKDRLEYIAPDHPVLAPPEPAQAPPQAAQPVPQQQATPTPQQVAALQPTGHATTPEDLPAANPAQPENREGIAAPEPSNPVQSPVNEAANPVQSVKPGETFTHNGREYRMHVTEDGQVKTRDLSIKGGPPIVRSWGPVADFEKEAGLKVDQDSSPVETPAATGPDNSQKPATNTRPAITQGAKALAERMGKKLNREVKPSQGLLNLAQPRLLPVENKARKGTLVGGLVDNEVQRDDSNEPLGHQVKRLLEKRTGVPIKQSYVDSLERSIRDFEYNDTLDPANKNSRAIFTQLTGRPLPNTIKGTKDVLAQMKTRKEARESAAAVETGGREFTVAGEDVSIPEDRSDLIKRYDEAKAALEQRHAETARIPNKAIRAKLHQKAGADFAKVKSAIKDALIAETQEKPDTSERGTDGLPAKPDSVDEGLPAGEVGTPAAGEPAGPVASGEDAAGQPYVATAGGKGSGRLGHSGGGVRGVSSRGSANSGQPVQSGREEDAAGLGAGNRDLPKAGNYDIATGGLNSENLSTDHGKRKAARANLDALKLLKKLESSGRFATPEEQKILAKYTGWGGIDKAVDTWRARQAEKPEAEKDNAQKKWEKVWGPLHKELADLLTPEEMDTARTSILNAHYTSQEVISGIWKALDQMGFKGGKAIEPSAGIGNFIGLVPEGVRSNTSWMGVELDRTTAGILKHLYQDAQIFNAGFQDVKFQGEPFDLAISNFPFSDKIKFRYDGKSHPIHDYFFLKSLDAVKPGGMVVAITSHYTMDKMDSGIRQKISEAANFVGAIRLPHTAFEGNAGTSVVTDIIFLQKKGGETPADSANWMDVKPVTVTTRTGQTATPNVNQYFHEHPEMVLGEWGAGGLQREDQLNVTPRDTTESLLEQIAGAAKHLPQGIASVGEPGQVDAKVESSRPEMASAVAAGAIRDGSLVEKDGDLRILENGQLVHPDFLGEYETRIIKDAFGKPILTKAGKERKERVLTGYRKATAEEMDTARTFTELKQTLEDLLSEENQESPDEDRMNGLREELNTLYDKLIEPRPWKKGTVRITPLSEKPQKGERHPLAWLKEDIDYPSVASLEKPGDPAKGIGTQKGPIFTQRVLMPPKEPTAGSMDHLGAALSASLVWRGKVDPDYIATLSGKTTQEVEQALPRERQAFIDPATKAWDPAPTYLSGNVREKLAKAKAAGAGFEENVAALEAVQPLPKVFEQIAFDMTTPWVPAEILEQAMSEVAGVSISAQYLKVAGAWSVEVDGITNGELTAKYAGDGFDAKDLVKASIAGRAATVQDAVWDSTSRKYVYVTNPVKTAAAQVAQRQLENDYQEWSQSRAKDYEDAYNEKVNHSVAPEYPVPEFEHYPEANRTIKLEKYQKRGNERALIENTLLAHAVGTGKTFTEITNGIEAKRRGFAQKPMIVVQNATGLQYAAAARFLYPNKRVLSLDADPTPGTRRRFLAQLRTSNFDLAIIPMSVFNMIPDNPARILAYIQEQKRLLEDELRGMSHADKKSAERTQKQAQNALDKLSDKLMTQAARVTDGFTPWDSLGIDWLIVDESHNYKKLGFFTQRNRIKGIDDTRSKRAMSLFIKAQAVREKQGGKNRGLIFATGTPVANTMAELWTIGRYLNPELNTRYGLTSFDGFVGNFGKVVSNFEYSPTGQYRYVPSLSKFKNAHEFQTYFLSFADRVGKDQVERQVLPELVGGDRTIFHVEPSATTARIIEGLAKRLRDWYDLSGAEKKLKSAEPLVVEGLATAAAIDPRLVDPTISFDPDTKLMEAVKWAHNLWKEGKAEKTATVLFLDRYRSPDPESQEGAHLAGIPRFNAHHEIRDRLIEMGVPAKEIFLFTEASKAQTEVAMDAANRGDIRILVATSEKGGVGLNFQIKLKNLGHIDLPMRPCDLEQREGRQIRAGNEFPLVSQGVFGTKKSLDTLKAQRLFRKQGFINQFLYGKLGQSEDEFSDIGSGDALSYNDMVGQFSGDPRVIRKAELEKELQGVQNQRAAFYSGIANAKVQIRSIENQIDSGKKHIESIQKEMEDIKGLPEIVSKEGLFDGYRAMTKEGEAFLQKLEAEWAAQGGGHDGKMAKAFDDKYEDWKEFPSKALDLGGGIKLEAVAQIRGKIWGPEHALEYKITKGGKTLFEATTKQTVGNNVKNAILHHLQEVPVSLGNAETKLEYNQNSLKGFKAKLGGTWAQEDHLASLQAELDALKAELEAEGLHAKDGDQIPEGTTEDADTVAEVDDADEDSTPSMNGESGMVAADLLAAPAVILKGLAKTDAGQALLNHAGGLKDAMQAIVAPATMNILSQRAADIHSGGLGKLHLQDAQRRKILESAGKAMSRLTHDEALDLFDVLEGKTERATFGRTPKERTAISYSIDFMRKTLDDKWKEVIATGQKLGYIEHFFPHMYKDPEKARPFLEEYAKRPMEGSKDWAKHRTIPYLSEAVREHGLEPASWNPIDMFLARVFDMDKFLAGHAIFEAYKKEKLARYVRAARTAPEGWVPLDDRIAVVSSIKSAVVKNEETGKFEAQTMVPGAKTIYGQYYAPAEVARIFNNYLTPGFNGTLLKQPYNFARAANNTLNMAQLGLSAFHATFILLETSAGSVSRGMMQIARDGNWGPGLANIAKGAALPVSWAETMRDGIKFRNALLSDECPPEYRPLRDMFIRGGGRVAMDTEWSTSFGKHFLEGWRQAFQSKDIQTMLNGKGVFVPSHAADLIHRGKGVIKGTAVAPFALVETLAKPIMQHQVPLMKLGTMAQLFADEMGRLPADATPAQIDRVARKVVDHVEDRMGQMTYDNLHWNAFTKQTMTLALRAVGWDVGSWRMIGGAGADLLATAPRAARALAAAMTDDPTFQKDIKAEKERRDKLAGEYGHNTWMTWNITHTFAMMALIGLVNGLLTWMLTGKPPSEAKDLLFFKTGRKDKYGKDERLQPASYAKEVVDIVHLLVQASPVHWAHGHPTLGFNLSPTFKYLWGKRAPFIGASEKFLTNKDWRGQQVYTPNAGRKTLEEFGLALIKEFAPISGTQTAEKWETQGGVKSALPSLGLTKPKQEMINTTAENKLVETLADRMPRVIEKAKGDRENQIRTAKDALVLGNRKPLEELKAQGLLTAKDQKNIMNNFKAQSLIVRLSNATNIDANDLIKIWDDMTPEEKTAVFPAMTRKIGSTFKSTPPAQRTELKEKWKGITEEVKSIKAEPRSSN